MIRLNKLTDYAVVLLVKMADVKGVVTVSALAESTGLPTPTIAKVLKKMTKSPAEAPLVRATRGAAGGYQIMRLPEEITVADIISAIDGPIAVTDCVTGSGKKMCSFAGRCGLHHHWDKVNTAVRAALGTVTLRDLTTSATTWPQSYDQPHAAA